MERTASPGWLWFKPINLTYEEVLTEFKGSFEHQLIVVFRSREQEEVAESLARLAKAAQGNGEKIIMVSREDFERIHSYWR